MKNLGQQREENGSIHFSKNSERMTGGFLWFFMFVAELLCKNKQLKDKETPVELWTLQEV